jgi:sugar lactone lactonase YvrE
VVNGKTATSSSDFIVNASAPAIVSVNPELGEVGTTLELSGANFTAGAKVYIGAIEATDVVVVSTTKITAKVPAGVSSAKVRVVMGDLQAESPHVFYMKPIVTAVSPLVAPKDVTVTLRGNNFVEHETSVKFGAIDVAQEDIYFVSPSEVKVKVPAGLAATPVKISVSVKGQTVESTEPFTVFDVTSFTASAKGGESITITGSGFSTTSSENGVKINDMTATVTDATATTLTVIVPVGASSGYITVSRNGYTITTNTRLHYQFVLRTTTISSGSSFSNPSGVAVDKSGYLYVADQYHHRILKVGAGGNITVFAGSGVPGSANGTGTAAQFNYPTRISFDKDGYLYVADLGNHQIRKVSPAGQVTTLAGEAGKAGAEDGIGTAAHFHSPAGIAVDNANNVYVADAGNHLIRKISPSGEVNTVAGKAGVIGAANGKGTEATFNWPSGIAIDAMGTLYVADEANHMIRKITTTGDVTTLAGAGTPGTNNGSGTAARFNFPQGIVMNNGIGKLYVTDGGNHTIREVSTTGVVSTLAGIAGIPGNTNGEATQATFTFPSGIITDVNGFIYVADKGNNQIRKISLQ